MKKITLLASICFFLVACKKDKKTTPAPDILVGKWSMVSWQQTVQGGSGFSASDTQYPCLGSNILQINSDNTATSSYTGTAPCYVTAVQGGPGSIIIGMPGQSVTKSTWSRNGNTIHFGDEYGVLVSNNIGYYLTLTDTLTSGGTVIIINSVHVKL